MNSPSPTDLNTPAPTTGDDSPSEVAESNESTAKPSKQSFWIRYAKRVAIELAIFFVLYFLSIGPMFWYWFEAVHLSGSNWIVAFYGPLLFLSENFEFFGDLVNWYIELWIL